MKSRVVLALTVLAGPASAYQLKETNDGLPIRWPDGPVAFTVALRDVPDGVSPTQVERAAGEAIDTWAAAMPQAMAVEGQAVRQTPTSGNVIQWVHTGWEDDFDTLALAMTLTTYEPGTGVIRDADVFVNAADFEWETDRPSEGGSSCTGRYDVENVVTHELGHALGLAHEETVTEATMFPRASMCEVKKRDLDADDEAGISELYSMPVGTELGGETMGCSVGARGRAGTGAALVVAIVIAFVARRRRVLALVPLFVAAAWSSASATTLRRVAVEELASRSTHIVRAQEIDRQVVEVAGRIYTDHVMAVGECWKGECEGTLIVRVLGGEKDGVGLHVEGAPVVRKGAEMVLFLRPRKDGAFAVTGLELGAFRVADGGDEVIRIVSGKLERLSLEKVRRAAHE